MDTLYYCTCKYMKFENPTFAVRGSKLRKPAQLQAVTEHLLKLINSAWCFLTGLLPIGFTFFGFLIVF